MLMKLKGGTANFQVELDRWKEVRRRKSVFIRSATVVR